ncbi:MAG: bifunctional (p)ppGpp synthetase/guanosine-3',5'-bis(diphosphate) 3'-pyrophosphohydrolase [Lachnospiraceae bacterium]|jgi:guanosine-3',5'-bis(diphosphate) 3'-pyrophosphohydrolase|nr:bifunctional (p)ppGpp synthetase/guanosine-3',5'-bis(diphosphate) 3'-pyrophosphohydrolase [Lachnospiraceae bacterium]
MIKRAAEFAARAHEGKFRKGTLIPYIVHPYEAAVIVSGMTSDPEIISAALLHDVIEDAGITYGELEREFGPRVADLVQAESEDKTLSWQERKQSTIRRLETALPEEKILCLGDKLSNLRSTASDRLIKGERVWEKFRVKDKKKHEWYYRRILEQLSELKERLAYREYVMLFQELFE